MGSPRKTRTDAESRVLVAEAMAAAELAPELFRYPTKAEREKFAAVVKGLARRGCKNAAIARVIGCDHSTIGYWIRKRAVHGRQA